MTKNHPRHQRNFTTFAVRLLLRKEVANPLKKNLTVRKRRKIIVSKRRKRGQAARQKINLSEIIRHLFCRSARQTLMGLQF